MLKILQMATDKKGFILYADQKALFDQLPNDKAGELIKFIFSYVNDENPISEDLIINLAFTPIQQQLKRDLIKYKETKESRSKAGKAGANKRWQNITEDSKGISSIAKIADNVNDNVNVKENVINNIDFQALLEFINSCFGRNFRVMNNSIKDKYKSLLKQGYTKLQITDSINNCKNNEYHKQNNYLYCTPEFFSRSVIIDKYSNVSKTDNSKVYNPNIIHE
jgi:hypothetical protein